MRGSRLIDLVIEQAQDELDEARFILLHKPLWSWVACRWHFESTGTDATVRCAGSPQGGAADGGIRCGGRGPQRQRHGARLSVRDFARCPQDGGRETDYHERCGAGSMPGGEQMKELGRIAHRGVIGCRAVLRLALVAGIPRIGQNEFRLLDEDTDHMRPLGGCGEAPLYGGYHFCLIDDASFGKPANANRVTLWRCKGRKPPAARRIAGRLYDGNRQRRRSFREKEVCMGLQEPAGSELNDRRFHPVIRRQSASSRRRVSSRSMAITPSRIVGAGVSPPASAGTTSASSEW